MIKAICFQKEWIEKLKRQKAYIKINPPLVEKMIHALSLVQHLKVLGLDFIFKGGTSLILLLEKASRFSIDVDIITKVPRPEIESLLDKVITGSPFTSWQLDAARSYRPGVPKAHYRLEYVSHFNRSGNHILLDILFEDDHYPEVRDLPILSHWIDTETIILVKLPTIESITGDKLTALAPNTTGIQYGKGKELEIIKQLFDLNALFDGVEKVEVVAASYAAFVAKEISYRGLSLAAHQVLWDTIEICRVISFRESNKKEPDRTIYQDLQAGIQNFSNHLINGKFQLDQAIGASAKVAYLAARLLKGDYSPLLRYKGQPIQTLTIGNPQWNILNKLKRLPDQSAFFYWYECLKALTLIDSGALLN
jgi:hypothetical protein